MEIFVYHNGSEKVEENVLVTQLPEILKDERSFVWVDLEEPTVEQEQEVLAKIFNFHPLTIEDCRMDHSQPKIEEFPDYLYFIVHGVRNEANSRNFATKELDGYIGKNFVVTYHHDNFLSIDNVKRQIRSSPIACARGGSYLLHHILDQIVDLYAPVIEDFEQYIIKLEDRIFRLTRANNRILAEIVRLKRNVIRMRRVSTKQLDILYRLSHGEFKQIDSAMLPFYRDIYDHLQRVSDLSESYKDLVSSLMDTYLSVLANRTNDVMKTLTIFSAMMLPLTVITGIYGMNFENMPELKTRTGYFVVLGVMILVALGMLSYFWYQGWIGGSDADDEKTPEDRDLTEITIVD
ncbi:MAG: magnesium/cobalt transporter CorA [Pyrinomonadaceae bacterium]